MWEIIAREAYNESWQFRSISELIKHILEGWNVINFTAHHNVSQGMKNRCPSLSEARVKKVNYWEFNTFFVFWDLKSPIISI